MELTPQLLTDEIDFRIAVRGYDRNEVDDFLERVAVAVGQLQSQLTKAAARAKSAEKRLAEIDSGAEPMAERAAAPVSEAPEPATKTEAEPPIPVPKAPSAARAAVISEDEDLNEELRRTLVLAQRTADAAIREAHEQARTIIEQASEDARQERSTAEEDSVAARAEARGRLLEEIAELEAVRETMRDDTVVLERYLGAERARVRETIQVLRRLVDDPRSFVPEAVPELSGAQTPRNGPASQVPELAPVAPEPTPEVSEPVAEDRGAEKPVAEDRGAEKPVAESLSDERDSGPDADSAVDDAPDPAQIVAPDVPSAAPTHHQDAPEDDAPHRASPADGAPTDVTSDAGHAQEDVSVEGSPSDLPLRGGSEAESLGQLFDSADASRDWRSAGPARGDQGPHTQPVAAARFEEESDEAFLAELRRAMDDDEPLGPEGER